MRIIERSGTGTEKLALVHVGKLFRQAKHETVNRIQPGLRPETTIEDFARLAADDDGRQQPRKQTLCQLVIQRKWPDRMCMDQVQGNVQSVAQFAEPICQPKRQPIAIG